MGDASVPQMPQGPNMMGDPNAMPQDPNMMNIDPNMMQQPMDANMGQGGQDMMPQNQEQGEAKKREEIQKNIGKACNDYREYLGQDKEELGKWINGMLDSLDTEENDSSDIDMDSENLEQMPPMPPTMESVKVTKRQLSEMFRQQEKQNDEKPKFSEKTKIVKNSPFNNPKTNK